MVNHYLAETMSKIQIENLKQFGRICMQYFSLPDARSSETICLFICSYLSFLCRNFEYDQNQRNLKIVFVLNKINSYGFKQKAKIFTVSFFSEKIVRTFCMVFPLKRRPTCPFFLWKIRTNILCGFPTVIKRRSLTCVFFFVNSVRIFCKAFLMKRRQNCIFSLKTLYKFSLTLFW